MIKTVFSPRSKSTKTRTGIGVEEAAELERAKALRAQKELAAFGTDVKRSPGALSTKEIWWCQQYQWLKSQGYLLRPRYAPDWIPSWEASKRDPLACEDGQVMRFGRIMDATRLSDGLYVSLKVIKKSQHPHEAEIGRYFTKVELASDPKNHCVPFLDVLSIPGEDDTQIIVMPLLLDFTKLPFDTFGEVVEMLRQLFEGLLFMHKHRVAHCDFMWMNIMMDAKDIYVEPYHPVRPHMKRDFSGHARHCTRTQRPPKYYIIDFGLSRQYDANDETPLEYPVLGGDKTVPEFQNDMNIPLNPFPTDVYYLGNLIREQFLNINSGFEFLKPLVDDMVQDDPSKRPTMEQAVERFESIRQGLSTWTLRSRVTARDEGFIVSHVSAVLPNPRQVPPGFFANVQDHDPVRYPDSPGAQNSELKKKPLSDANPTRHPPIRQSLGPRRVPQGFFDGVETHDPPSLQHRHRSFTPSWGSRPRALLARLPQLFSGSQPNTDEPIELQQRQGPPCHRPSIVDVPCIDDRKALYVTRRPETASERIERIKNPKWWVRVLFFICCVSPSTDDGVRS